MIQNPHAIDAKRKLERRRLAIVQGLAVCAAFLLAAFLAYQPALSGGFVWDDEYHITKPELRGLDGLWRIWIEPSATQQYYPLAHSAFWLLHRFFGEAPSGYHFTNVVLHAVNAALVWVILRRVRMNAAAAFLAAGLFLLHPVQVESVAWITELKNTLSGLFYLSAALVYLPLTGITADEQSGDERKIHRRLRYAMVVLLFIAALLTKSVTASWPAAMLLLIWWRCGRLDWRRDVLPLLPFFVFGAAAGISTAWFEQSMWGAEGETFDFTWSERVLIAGRASWFYLGKLLWPAQLTFFYERWIIDPSAWWQWLYPAGVVAALAVLWALRRLIGRGPLAAVLFFGGTLVPSLGFFNLVWQVYTFVCDHMQYIACLGVFMLGSALLIGAARRLAPRTSLAPIATALVLATCGWLTWRQAHMYRDIETLWLTTIERNPTCWMAFNNLGTHYRSVGRTDDAVLCLERCLELRPQHARAWANLGLTRLVRGERARAIHAYEQAVSISPDFHQALNNLAWLLATSPDESLRAPGRALAMADRAASLTGHRNASVLATLAAARAAANQFPSAIQTAEQARALAQAEGNVGLDGNIQRQLQQYRAGKPYIDRAQ